jgi:diaminohydroxyphosphoribosylaminopyrimidine deaminase/5-amino-6-(5-phosphoribosylamino)uracil reductase
MRDPNPQVSGRGLRFLRRHGLHVATGVLAQEAQELNRTFSTWVREHRPYVTLKTAVSLDGKIATARGESRWITGGRARALGHRLRAEADAAAVGIETVLQDNPQLTAHGRGPNPMRVVFDSHLRFPLRSRLARGRAPTWILTTARASVAGRAALEKKGITVYRVGANRRGQVSVPEAMRLLARQGVTHLLVEGGGTLHAAFLEAGLVDEVVWFIAPKLIGGAATKTAVEGTGVRRLRDAWRLKDWRVGRVGEDLCIRAKVMQNAKFKIKD